MMCNIANWAKRYSPRDENYENICDAYYEHYQCDCTDPENYNFEDKGRFLILNHYSGILVKNGMSNKFLLMTLIAWYLRLRALTALTYLIKNRKDLCSWFETSQNSFLVNNDDGMRKCEMALACGSSLPAECTEKEESDESGGSIHGQSPTSKKSGWWTFAAIAFAIIVFCALFFNCRN